MLIQITNRCRMNCPHCMDDSRADGGLMTEETFKAAIRFANDNGEHHVVISGGEPTEHPEMLKFCRIANGANLCFSIASNGMWLGDILAEGRMEEVSRLKGFVGGQIYTNPKWYRLHNETVAKWEREADRWRALKWNLDTEDIRAMSDVGRAKESPAAMGEVQMSKYHNMCLTACVTAAQVGSLADFFHLMLMQRMFCTPLVDWKGDLHMSESCLCPSVGNVVKESAEVLWRAMKKFRPCGGCTPCKRSLTEGTPKMIMARFVLGMGGE